jgi:Family of unknown function (DUF6152)
MVRTVVRKKMLAAFSALAWAATPPAVWAHHSSAMFDQSRSLTLQGVVKEFRWTNPHASIQVLVESGQGRKEQWSIEMSSPEQLARAGWQPDTLKAGDSVRLVIHSMRDGTNGGGYLSGTGPRGPLISEPPPVPVSAQSLSPGVVNASCPRVDLTVVEPSASSEARAVKLGQHTIFVQRAAITTTSDISEIKVAGDDFDTLVRIKYKPDAAARLLDATTDHDGLKLAFVVDDDVWLFFTWQGPYGIGSDGTQLSLRHGMEKVQRLVESIRSCTDARTG